VLNATQNRRIWTNDEIDFLNSVSKQVSIVLEKIRLLDEKRVTDDLLIKQSHILRRVLDNSPCGIWMTDETGKMKFVNKTYCDSVGIPEARFLAVPHYAELYDDVIAGQCLKSDRETVEPNKPYTFYETVKFTDGKYHELEVIKSRITDEHNNPMGLIGISIDITEHKQAQYELEERKEKYRGLSEASYEAIFLSEKGVCIEQNQTAEKMFGYTSSEAIGRFGTEWIAPEDRAIVMNNMLRGVEEPYEVTALKKDGTTFPCLLRAKMMYYKGKDVRVTSLSDITERKRAENAERASELRYRSLFKTSPSGIMVLDENGIILEINKAVSNSTLYSPDELAGCDIRILSPKVQESMVAVNIQRILGGEVLEQEVLCLRKDGTICTFWLNEIAITLPNGRPGILSVSNDISERKKLELEKDRNLLVQEALNKILHISIDNIGLEESLEKVLITILSLPFLSLEKKGGIFLVNEKQNCLELKAAYNFGNELTTKGAQFPLGQCHCGRAAADGEIQFSDFNDYRYDNTRQGTLPHGHYDVPILGQDSVFGVIAIYFPELYELEKFQRDFLLSVAEILSGLILRKKSEEALEESQMRYRMIAEELDQRVRQRTAELETVNRELETFSYSVSHDLKTPLRHITGFIDLFLDNLSSEFSAEKLGYLKQITDSATKMGQLIDALLSFSRLNQGELHKTIIHSSDMVQKIIIFFEPERQNRTIKFNIEPLPDINGDEGLIGQVWTNLISNAIKYTEKKAEAIIDIGSISTDKMTTFFIRDNGAGFHMKDVEKLFGVFHRLHKTSEFDGVGIGLANVNRIITRHGGHCNAAGEPDKGAVFYFSIPK
jgi:PAS domain S-box-containing protein